MVRRIGWSWVFVALGCASPASVPPSAPPTSTIAGDLAIVHADVFDGRAWLDDATVVIDDGKIAAVGPGLAIDPATPIYDAAGKALVPGFIDAHTHVQQSADLTQALMFGVTTEIDMFTVPSLVAALSKDGGRQRAEVISAGILATAPGGHGTEYGIEIPTVDSPAEANAFVKARLAEGSRFLKIVYDGGQSIGIEIPTIDRATLAALVAAAHEQQRIAVVHIGTSQEAAEAVEAGADGLAHSFGDALPTPAFVEAARRRNVFITDTLPVMVAMCGSDHGRQLAADPELAPLLPPIAARSLADALKPPIRPDCARLLAIVRALHEADITLLASTDAPNPGTTHGASLHGAMSLLVEAGFTPNEALSAATARPAEAFSLDERGTIAPGRRADLVLLASDPRQDIRNTRAIVEIWKRGEQVDRTEWIQRVARQRAEIERQRQAPPPEGFGDGSISTFDASTLASSFGAGWQPSTDAMQGGTSMVDLDFVRRGKGQALRMRGTIRTREAPPWAGALFSPGPTPLAPANLTTKPILEFWAKSATPVNVVVYTQSRGQMPGATTVPAAPQGAVHRVDLRTLVDDPYDVTAIFLGAPPEAGAFEILVDDVRLRDR